MGRVFHGEINRSYIQKWDETPPENGESGEGWVNSTTISEQHFLGAKGHLFPKVFSSQVGDIFESCL